MNEVSDDVRGIRKKCQPHDKERYRNESVLRTREHERSSGGDGRKKKVPHQETVVKRVRAPDSKNKESRAPADERGEKKKALVNVGHCLFDGKPFRWFS